MEVITEVSFFFNFIYLFLNRGEERETDWREISMFKRDQLVASLTPPTRDLAHNPGMYPDHELNQGLFTL